jgi:peptidoglycan/xylan/chitin deacetylase (PgdA/CDA1 family)
MELKVGLLNDSNNGRYKSVGWEVLLRQIGVSYEVLSAVDAKNTFDFPVCILADNINQRQVNESREFIQQGGNVLCSTDVLTKISKVQTSKAKVNYLAPDETGIFPDTDIIDIDRNVNIAEGSNHLRSNHGQFAVYRGEMGKGNIIAFPFDVESLILDVRSKKKSFYAHGKRLPYETVSAVSKGGLRRLTLNSLEYLFHSKNLPFVHLWYFPKDSKSIFSFRIDTDKGKREQIESLYQLSLKHKIPFTWFEDAMSQKDWVDAFATMTDQEIGVHCYEHKVYNSYAENYKNIRKALDVLKVGGINPKGFASPFGRWNSSLAQAIRDLNFKYSSEFAYDYDNLPSNTLLFDNPTSVLQIPIHPICIGSLWRQGFSKDEMEQYFRYQVDKKLFLNEPIIFYHHPTHNHLEVIENILNYVKDKNVPAMRMTNYADWWKKRNEIKTNMSFNENCLKVRGENHPDDVYFRITTSDGREALVQVSESNDLSGIQFRKKPLAMVPPKDISRIRKFNKWMLINKIEDYFHG